MCEVLRDPIQSKAHRFGLFAWREADIAAAQVISRSGSGSNLGQDGHYRFCADFCFEQILRAYYADVV